MAQLVEHPTLGFGSGHDLMVREFEPALTLQSLLGILSLSLSLSAPPLLVLCHSLSQNE